MKNALYIFLTSIIFLTSCNGQVKPSKNSAESIMTKGQIVSQIDKSIWVIFQDKNNNYWFGSNGRGVFCYDGKIIKQFTTKEGLYSNHIRGIQEDKSGNIYFDTPEGVTQFDGEKFIALMPVKSLFNQWKLKPNDLWFKGNADKIGAFRYDGDILYQLAFSTISPKIFNANHVVYSIYKDKQSNIWFGTLTGGVGRYNGTTLDWIFENELGALEDGRAPAIRAIIEDEDGYFWFSNLLYQYKIQHNNINASPKMGYERVKRIDVSEQSVKMKLPYFTSAVVDKGNIWMTNYSEGVWLYDGKKFTNYCLKDGKTNVLPMFIYKDNFGTLWLGTDNAGIYKFNGQNFEKFK